MLQNTDGQTFRIDYLDRHFQNRLKGKSAGPGGELLRKAVLGQLKPNKDKIHILDATAGLAKDSLLFAAWGCQVTACEQSHLIYTLVASALKTAQLLDPDFSKITEHLKILNMNAIDWMRANPQSVDVVYLDPMFPDTGNTALPSKEMQMMRLLLEDQEQQEEQLFLHAVQATRKRVVVKRHAHAPAITDSLPVTHSFEGKSSRFDLYLV